MRAHRFRQSVTLNVLELESRVVPTFLGNQLFPLDNPWNQNISGAPVASNSAAILSLIASRNGGNARAIHADFGNPTTDGELYGIPINIATSSTTKYTIYFPSQGYPDESDIVQVPIPDNAVIEGDGPTGPRTTPVGDSHLLVYDRDANVLYELYQTLRPGETNFPYGGTKPSAGWGAYQISVWNLNTNDFRTVGDTSADAAGLPILTGLVRPDEARPVSAGGAGVIDHAIRMTVQQTRNSYVYPASHFTTGYTQDDRPRMGERFRLKASFTIPSNWSAEAKAIAQTMKTYGMIVADNGSDMYFQGQPSTSWNMSSVLQVQSILSSDFEVVDLTPRITSLSVNSGSPAGGTSVTINGQNFSGAAGRLHVYFGTTEATSFTIVSDTRIVVTTPAHAVGRADVRVQSGESELNNNNQTVFFGYGSSANTATDDFTFGAVSPPLPGSPPPPPASPPGSPPARGSVPVLPIVVNSPPGSQVVRVLNPGGTTRLALTPHPGFFGGIVATAGDTNGDGVADVVTAATFGGHVKVFNGVNNAELRSFYAFEGYVGAINLAVGDLTGDGKADLIVAANLNGHVKVYDGVTGAMTTSFFAYAGYTGPVGLAAADLTGDGRPELITAADSGVGVHVKALAPDTLALRDSFFATGPGNGTGFSLSGGDLDGDGIAEFLVSQGPRVRVLDSVTKAARADFFAFDSSSTNRVTVQAAQFDGDANAELIAIAEVMSRSHVKVFDGPGLGPAGSFFADTQ